MRARSVLAVFLGMAMVASAQARKSCEDLKSEIAKKLDDKGVKSYSLEIVEKDKATEGKIVGTCDGGTKQIVYSKAAAPKAAVKPEAKSEAKPAASKPKS